MGETSRCRRVRSLATKVLATSGHGVLSSGHGVLDTHRTPKKTKADDAVVEIGDGLENP